MEGISVHVDTASIPDFRRRALAKCVLASLDRALSEPGAEEEFQAWLIQYRKKQAEKALQSEGGCEV